MGVKMLRIAGLVLCGAGILWFCLPFFYHSFGIGGMLGIFLCLWGGALLLFYPKVAGKKGKWQVGARLCLSCYLVGLCWCGYLSFLIFQAQQGTPPAGADVVVLGSQVLPSGELSLSLRHRVSKAGEYLLENPDSRCITTGGQGDTEPKAEALAEKEALVKQGVAENRIFLEDKSRNTRQNFVNAKKVAEKQGIGPEILVVTQGFHMYRACEIAKSAGFVPSALVADTNWMMFPEYFGRELLSLTKWSVESLFMEPTGD